MKELLMHERIDGIFVNVEYHTLSLKKIAFTSFLLLPIYKKKTTMAFHCLTSISLSSLLQQ